jgi:hypothetical protein
MEGGSIEKRKVLKEQKGVVSYALWGFIVD